MNRVVFKSATDEWSTPKDVYAALDKEFGFKDDPCPMGGVWDGLYRAWVIPTFVNPPFTKIGHWISKAYTEHLSGYPPWFCSSHRGPIPVGGMTTL